MGHEHMLDAKMGLADDVQPVGEEKIVVLVDTSREGVLDRHDAVADLLFLDGFEDIFKRVTGDGPSDRTQERAGCDLAVGSGNTLECDGSGYVFHRVPADGLDFRPPLSGRKA
jgi:hypothetical protein